MPVITTAPPAVDSAQVAEISSNNALYPIGVSPGPWFINGAWYMCLAEYPDGNPNHTSNIAVYKWSGSAWVQKDGVATVFPIGWIPTYPGTGNLIYVLGTQTSVSNSNARVQAFDCTTDTWNARSADSGKGDLTNARSDQLVVQSATDQWFWYWSGAAFPNWTLCYRVLSGGVWGPEVVVTTITDTGPTFNFLGNVVEGSGRYHLVYRVRLNAGTETFYYVQVSALGVVSAPVSILATSDAAFSPVNASLGYQPCIAGTNLYFPISWFNQSSGQYEAVVFVGTGLSSPVWTVDTVNDGSAIDNLHFWIVSGSMAVDLSGNPIYFYAIVTTGGAAHTPFYQILYQIKSAGVWGSAVVFFDSDVTPVAFPMDASRQALTGFYATLNADANWSYGFCDTVKYAPPGSNINSMAFAAVEVATILTLACPVSNAISAGVPYSGTLVRTGGTGPFTFSITAGALPPGFTLNTSTGAITGTTSAIGSWTYTAQVTDSLGATAHITCTFVVGGGGGGGGGTPCQGVVAAPSTDNQFELTRAVATLKPASRLPVRGRST